MDYDGNALERTKYTNKRAAAGMSPQQFGFVMSGVEEAYPETERKNLDCPDRRHRLLGGKASLYDARHIVLVAARRRPAHAGSHNRRPADGPPMPGARKPYAYARKSMVSP